MNRLFKMLFSNKISEEKLQTLPFMDERLDIEERVNDFLERLTLEEKISLLSGKWIFFSDRIKRLRMPYFKTTDGPHGVGSGVFYLKKMTYFPVAICRAATWNPDLSQQFGVALAQETRATGRHLILAPGINIIRTPLCGRNFEYQTEDPFLNKKLAVEVVKGIQSQKIGACVKHFAANNQEYKRFEISCEVSERALEEIYFPAFEATVREVDVWSFMACYNRLNGTFGCEHVELLREKLMKQWGFSGFVVSDWFATRDTNTVECLKAGLSLEMPKAICYKEKKVKNALSEGKVSEDTFEDNLRRLLRVMFRVGLFDSPSSVPEGSRNTEEHQKVARKIAEEGIILLKNQDDLLPLDINAVNLIAILGPNADKKMAFGGGSSMVRAKYEVTPEEGLKSKCEGMVNTTTKVNDVDAAIIFAGLNHKKHNDRENKDRLRLDLPKEQVKLIKRTVKKVPKTIVVLINGGPISMDDWLADVPAVIEAWYAGMEAGNVIADVIFGDVNPSGKLSVTFPKKLADSPAHIHPWTYPGIRNVYQNGDIDLEADDFRVYYNEGIFVGYRYFDTFNVEPIFPFGYGLSYTTFNFSNLSLNKEKLMEGEDFNVKIELENTGKRTGAEVVQVYIKDKESSVKRPEKELCGFKKVFLTPGEKQSVEISIDSEALAFYDEGEHQWKVEKGKFLILVGNSSRHIKLSQELEYIG
ncbi:MAG: glycoside hydrolase family 3 C-terminal domain-containing protein [Promethearchaeia archaeon]